MAQPLNAIPLLLASASPRRSDLLSQIGFSLRIVPVDIDEAQQAGESPSDYVERVALAKALFSLENDWREGELGIAADTIVWLDDGSILGKPTDPQDAQRMLRTLAGRAHHVTTAFVLFSDQLPGRLLQDAVTTTVTFAPLSDADIAAYVQTDEPHDKAGSYAIQGFGAAFVEKIDGSWSNVVGLPVTRVVQRMREAGLLQGMPWARA